MTWGTNIATTDQNAAKNVTPGPSEWDVVILGGQTCPGVARVSVKVPSGLDVQKGKGKKRAKVKDNGDPLIEVRIELTMQPDDIEEFRDFILPDLRPPSKNGGRDPLTILHPACEIVGVDKIIVGTIDFDPPEPGGTMRVSVDCYEWAPAPAESKSTGKVKDSGGDKPPEPELQDDPRNLAQTRFGS